MIPHTHTPEEERAVVPQDGPSCYICLLTDLRARLAEVEAERDALRKTQGGYRFDEALRRRDQWKARAEQAEAREKAKDERIKELEEGIRGIADEEDCCALHHPSGFECCMREAGVRRMAEEILSTPSPSQPVKVAEETC